MKNHKAKIMLVDDHPIVRERLAELINQQADLTVCCDCDDAPDCWKLLETNRPDLMILDLTLKTTPGLELIKDLQRQYPTLPVLVLTMHDEALYAERALRAGAHGYVTKQEATAVILAAIRRVLAGELYVGDKLAQQLVGAFIRGPSTAAGQSIVNQLSNRELEVFQMLSEGQSTTQIAKGMKISIKTVESHQAALRDKCRVSTLNDLRRCAINELQRR